LNVEGNAINTISDNAFTGKKFKRIVLSENPINFISDRAFAGLENFLEELLMTFEQDNAQVEIPVVAFRDLTNLRLLEIRSYAKTSLPTNSLSTLINLEQLTLSFGGLTSLSQEDLLHQSKLVNLSLESNQMTSVPIIFKTPVGNLSTLRLDSNQISHISSGAFEGVGNLQLLDLSQNPLLTVDIRAFLGLENRLQSLSCRSCRLEDVHLSSFKSLRSLKELNIQGNTLTAIDSALRGMKSLPNLQRLNVQGNKITSISSSIFNDMSNSLKVLDLSDNPFTSIPPDAFVSLKQLRELQLNNIVGLQLDRDTFQSQRTTLKTLSLSGATFQSPQWAAVSNLTALQVLVLSKCNISNIPDFAFELNSNLTDLDLSDNNIESLSQRSLAGLQNSLVRIILSHNSIRALDKCTFYEFSKLDFNRFGLNNNPLRCGCELRWLYIKLKPFVSQLSVKCEDGTDFLNLETVLANCTSLDSPCESFLPSTVIPPNIEVLIGHLMSTSMVITWTIRIDLDVSNFFVAYRITGNADFVTYTLNASAREFALTGLVPGTTYDVCALVKTSILIEMQGCTTATTLEVPFTLSQQAIIGISVAAAVGFLFILVLVIVLLVRATSRRTSKHKIVPPQKSGKSKRFVKQSEHELEPVLSPTGLAVDSTLAQVLLDMPELEKHRLINLLTTSRNSMNNLDDRPTSGQRLYGHGGEVHNSSSSIADRQNIYEEIADGDYNTIDDSYNDY